MEKSIDRRYLKDIRDDVKFLTVAFKVYLAIMGLIILIAIVSAL